MSLLNQLFNRGVLGAKCKTCLNMVISRIKLVQNRRRAKLIEMEKEIAQYLQTGQEAIARIRVEHFVREHNLWAAYEVLELFCEFVTTQIPIMDNQRECPSELLAAVASIIFAAPKCLDLPDLIQIMNMFTAKYGKNFVSTISELRPDTFVNRSLVEKLSGSAPSAESKLRGLQKIARDYHVDWDSSRSNEEFNKKHEDLLDGSKQVYSEGPKNGNMIVQSSPKSFSCSRDAKSESGTSNVLERARAAVASAERASAAARAASELLNVDIGLSFPLK